MQKETAVVTWKLYYADQALKDSKKLAKSGLKKKAEILLEVLQRNPFQNPPPYEKLKGDLEGFYSRRINIQHRLVYEVFSKSKSIKVVRLWSHYE